MEYFLTTTFFDQLLTVERFAVGGAIHKVFGSFLKKFQRRKKFFAYVFDVDNGGENRIYRQGLHFETVLKHLLKRVNEYD